MSTLCNGENYWGLLTVPAAGVLSGALPPQDGGDSNLLIPISLTQFAITEVHHLPMLVHLTNPATPTTGVAADLLSTAGLLDGDDSWPAKPLVNLLASLADQEVVIL